MGLARVRRRMAFAASFITIAPACERPIETRPVSAEIAIGDAAVDGQPVPRELVAALPALGPYRSLAEMCRHAFCNPPPPKRSPPEAMTLAVAAIVREDAGSRIRFDRVDPRIDRAWEAAFVDRGGAPIDGGRCAIVAWDPSAIECTTALAPEQLVADRRTYRLRVVPPPPPPPPPPPSPSPPATAPRIVRVIQVRIRDNRTEVTIGEGADAGITTAWKARLVHPDGRAIPGGECVELAVSARRASCLTRLTMDQVRPLRLRLDPP